MTKLLLDIKKIECRYCGQTAVRKLSMHVNEGDLVCLLGPSGCGKTTVLRAIAGFESLYAGEIIIRDQVMSRPGYSRAPEKRNLGMVFQDYALFPHMDVNANIGFGLRNLNPTEKNRVVKNMLEVVDLEGFGQRYIHELSGGQQQRVALARALAPKPDLILMDEPFSNLDIEMREHLSQEVRQILKNQGATGVLVTHDQHEAFAIGDQIGVMHEGQILQWDTAYDLYHSPSNLFIADFIGQGVFLKGTLLTHETIQTELGIVKGDRAYDWPEGTKLELLVRPDDIVYDPEGDLYGEVTQKAFKGAEILYTLKMSPNIEVLSLFPSHHNHSIGERVSVRLAPDHMIAFIKE